MSRRNSPFSSLSSVRQNSFEMDHICSVCYIVKPSKDDLISHIKIEHLNWYPFACGICGVTRANEQMILEHVKCAHNGSSSQIVFNGNQDAADRLWKILNPTIKEPMSFDSGSIKAHVPTRQTFHPCGEYQVERDRERLMIDLTEEDDECNEVKPDIFHRENQIISAVLSDQSSNSDFNVNFPVKLSIRSPEAPASTSNFNANTSESPPISTLIDFVAHNFPNQQQTENTGEAENLNISSTNGNLPFLITTTDFTNVEPFLPVKSAKIRKNSARKTISSQKPMKLRSNSKDRQSLSVKLNRSADTNAQISNKEESAIKNSQSVTKKRKPKSLIKITESNENSVQPTENRSILQSKRAQYHVRKVCMKCGASPTANHLYFHVYSHVSSDPFSCSLCEYSAKHRAVFQSHFTSNHFDDPAATIIDNRTKEYKVLYNQTRKECFGI